MKTRFIRFLQTFADKIPLSFLLSITRQRHFFPFYHTISDSPLPHIQQLYQVRDSKQFEQDLDYLLRYFQPIGLDRLIESVREQKPLANRHFWLSFDDGLSQSYDIIAPILRRKGIPATFFINSAFVDNRALMFRYKASLLINHFLNRKASAASTQLLHSSFQKYGLNYTSPKASLLAVRWKNQALLDELANQIGIDFQQFLKEQKPYLSTSQIQSLIKDGFSIGSHSVDHPRYNSLPLEKQLSQTLDSQQFLTERFDLNYKSFAFPFTDAAVETIFFDKILGEEKFDLTFGGAGQKHERIKGQLQRFPMETESKTSAPKLIHSELLYYFFKMPFGKNTIRRG